MALMRSGVRIPSAPPNLSESRICQLAIRFRPLDRFQDQLCRIEKPSTSSGAVPAMGWSTIVVAAQAGVNRDDSSVKFIAGVL